MDHQEYIRFVRLEARVTRMETMMQALLARMGIAPAEFEPPEPPEPQAIREALMSGNKILAIKLYREHYGVGLKEAKDAVDAMEGRYRGY
jgi:ribosomal protein L7/L12